MTSADMGQVGAVADPVVLAGTADDAHSKLAGVGLLEHDAGGGGAVAEGGGQIDGGEHAAGVALIWPRGRRIRRRGSAGSEADELHCVGLPAGAADRGRDAVGVEAAGDLGGTRSPGALQAGVASVLTAMDAASLVSNAKGSCGLSVRALAARAGVAGSTITRIQAGAVDPTVDTLDRISPTWRTLGPAAATRSRSPGRVGGRSSTTWRSILSVFRRRSTRLPAGR